MVKLKCFHLLGGCLALTLALLSCQQVTTNRQNGDKPNEQGFYGKVELVHIQLTEYQAPSNDVAYQTSSKLHFSPQGLLIRTEQEASRMEHLYDKQGRKSQILVYHNGSLRKQDTHHFHYNDKGLMQSERRDKQLLTQYSYDSLGRISLIQNYTEDSTLYQQTERHYNTQGELTDEVLQPINAQADKQATHYHHKYNEQGQMVETTHDNAREVLTYNEHGQITKRAFYLDAAWIRSESYEYEYDSQGNWTRQTTYRRRPQQPVHKVREVLRKITYY